MSYHDPSAHHHDSHPFTPSVLPCTKYHWRRGTSHLVDRFSPQYCRQGATTKGQCIDRGGCVGYSVSGNDETVPAILFNGPLVADGPIMPGADVNPVAIWIDS